MNPRSLRPWWEITRTPSPISKSLEDVTVTMGGRAQAYDLTEYRRLGKAELRRQAEAAYEMACLEREHPSLYTALQAGRVSTSKEDIAQIGQASVLHQMEAKVQQYINSHRPTPKRAKPGEHPVPTGPVPSKERAWAALYSNDAEFRKLVEQYNAGRATLT
jgi:hypothetical protein